MADEADFLRAVIADPDDDGPRLVYADWLEEHGRPERAEFIRVQCELARLGDDDPRRPGLERRERDLLAGAVEWGLPLAEKNFTPRRGFVEKVAVGAKRLLTSADELFAAAPLTGLKILRINQTKNAAASLAALPHLARLRELDLDSSNLGDDNFARLLGSPHLAGLRRLEVTSARLTPGAWAVIRDAGLPHLTYLTASGNTLGSDTTALAGWEPVFRLKHLAMYDNGLTPAEAARLLVWPGLAGVAELDLTNNEVGDRGAEALAAGAHFSELTSLRLDGCAIGEAGTVALATSPRLVPLRHFGFDGNLPGTRGVRALLASPFAGRLGALELAACGLTADAAGVIAAWPRLGRLESLDLSSNLIGDEGLRALAHSPHAAGLRGLDIGYVNATADGVDAVLRSALSAGLERIRVSGNADPARTAETLLELNLPRLRYAWIDYATPDELKKAVWTKFKMPFGDTI